MRQARNLLASWARDHRNVAQKRDEVIQAAVRAGVSKSEIHRLTGVGRTTIGRIAGSAAGTGEEAAE